MILIQPDAVNPYCTEFNTSLLRCGLGRDSEGVSTVLLAILLRRGRFPREDCTFFGKHSKGAFLDTDTILYKGHVVFNSPNWHNPDDRWSTHQTRLRCALIFFTGIVEGLIGPPDALRSHLTTRRARWGLRKATCPRADVAISCHTATKSGVGAVTALVGKRRRTTLLLLGGLLSSH